MSGAAEPGPPDEILREILSHSRILAVVGLSNRPERASHYVSQSLQHAGYRIIPVNPNESRVLGETCYPTVSQIPDRVDMVIIFRRPEFAGAVVDEAIRKKARAIWMQVGVRDAAAARRAREAGLHVVMDRCAWVDYQRLFGRRL